MNQLYTLETVATHFSQWRESRSSKREATPEHLKRQAATLLQKHQKIEIRKALNISNAALKQWSVAYGSGLETKPYDSFIPVSPAQLGAANEAHSIRCEFPNGVRLRLSADTLNQPLLTHLFCLNSKAITP